MPMLSAPRGLWSAIRYGMVHCLSERLGLIIVNEFPKSGGTWLGQMLSRALNLPFPRNRSPILGPSIMHGHYLSGWGMKRVVVLFRDGRDVMISWYHHCLQRVESRLGKFQAPLVARVQKDLAFRDVTDVRTNLPVFLEYSFTRQRYPRFSWADFVDHWYDTPGHVKASFEALKEDGANELRRIVFELSGEELQAERAREVMEEFSFSRQTGREPGQEDAKSFLRKGIVGDWRNHFNLEAREIFAHFAGTQLEKLGYERDRRWVSSETIAESPKRENVLEVGATE